MNVFKDAPKILQPNLTCRFTLTSDPNKSMWCLSVVNKDDDIGIEPGQLLNSMVQWLIKFKKAIKLENVKIDLDQVDVILTTNETKSTWIWTVRSQNLEKGISLEALAIILEMWIQTMIKGLQ